MKIKVENFVIPTAKMGGVNPLPAFRKRKHREMVTSENFPKELSEEGGHLERVLPYLSQDRYNHTREPMAHKSIVLENEYLVATFFPSLGGRLHSLYDKTEKRQLLFTNTVIQPGNLAIRNAWLSGGIEWNIGNFGHTYTTCDNVFAAILQDDKGNDFLRIYEFERNKSIFWQVDFHLPDGSRELICHVKMVNPFDKDTTTYWWTNIAVPDDGNTRILASNKTIISFVNAECHLERLPYIQAMPGIDVTYPSRATRAFDYFIQKDNDGESTWEAAVYTDGLSFFERSTAPLYYKKLFAWGNTRSGNHWQEFLSDGEGTGYYAEIQGGIAPSQLHDKVLKAGETLEWTQCFGSIRLDKNLAFDKNYDAAVDAANKAINDRISFTDITKLNEIYTRLACTPVTEDKIVNTGSGFGALEIRRMRKDGDGQAPSSMLFPDSTIGSAEVPWLTLLETGLLPDISENDIPSSYMISYKWLDRIKEACRVENFAAYLHYGTALYEYIEPGVIANQIYNEERDGERVDAARRAWLRSVEITPNVWGYRNLAVLEEREGNMELAEEYYDKAALLSAINSDYAIYSEYLIFLKNAGKYEKLWSVFESLSEEMKRIDRIDITAAAAAVKLDKLDFLNAFFNREHYDIREGEVSLTDIWFEYSARRIAKERGITELTKEALDKLIDEAWDTWPPDPAIDFRMSLSKQNGYRVGD